MKQNAQLFIICILTLLLGCSDTGTDPGTIDNLNASFVRGSIGANLMPIILPGPDPIGCALDIRVQNTHNSSFLRGISIQAADVYLAQSKQKLGSLALATDWSGELAPGEIDTVHLFRPEFGMAQFGAPCGQYVYLEILLVHPTNKTRRITTDSLLFGCVY